MGLPPRFNFAEHLFGLNRGRAQRTAYIDVCRLASVVPVREAGNETQQCSAQIVVSLTWVAARQLSQTLQGRRVGSGSRQLTAFASNRAVVVLPVPRGPQKR